MAAMRVRALAGFPALPVVACCISWFLVLVLGTEAICGMRAVAKLLLLLLRGRLGFSRGLSESAYPWGEDVAHIPSA
jgi:hypothetical protein